MRSTRNACAASHSAAPAYGVVSTVVSSGRSRRQSSYRYDWIPPSFGGKSLVTTVPPGVDLSAYRIIQEALTNVIKHADGATATVRLDYGADALEVEVVDDGPGTTEPSAGGHGLIGIRERVAVVGGRVEAGPHPDGGFAVKARLPYALETT